MSTKIPHPLALIILDGWGHREEKNSNAIAAAHKPNWNKLLAEHTHTLISGCGSCVGLPDGQMGNSEVGHLNMGAGRIVYQDLTRVDLDIAEGKFFSNPVLTKAIEQAIKTNKAIHILGLVSPGGVHSHEKHIHALLDLIATRHAEHVYIHAFLDGRDTPPRSAELSLDALMSHCEKVKCGKIVSLIGRYYAMDRDNRWERIQKAYELLTEGKADFHAPDAITAIESAYERDEKDEFIKPTYITDSTHGEERITINDGDVVIFMNFRADRARQLTRALIDPDFTGFARGRWPQLADFVSLSEYDANLKTSVAYPPQRLDNILAEYLSKKGLHQLRLAETEKYAHVTFFFNGGIEKPYPNEDRVLIPSPQVATYDLKPEMSALELTARLVEEIKKGTYDVIICNYANPDMLGHTGNFAATVKAIEYIDYCLGNIITALKEVGGEALITADHGNAELMFNENTGQAHTAHTTELVPFVYFGRPAKITKPEGILSDIAPTMLYLLDLPKPKEMTGESLIELNS